MTNTTILRPCNGWDLLKTVIGQTTKIEIERLESLARQARGAIVELSWSAQAPHLGSSLSCVDILVAAYWHALRFDPEKPHDPNRDRLILSKGHAAQALYTVLNMLGLLDAELLKTFNRDGGRLAEHPGPNCALGVEAATGSLGHGLPIGVGLALAGKVHKRNYRTFVVLSDGECNEGSVWEAALLAAAQKLENLFVIIDYNKWQATDRSDHVMALHPLVEKWSAFGWSASEIDGHDVGALASAMEYPTVGGGKPVALIAHTVKGKGVSFMEDDNNWHYRLPTEEEVILARRELRLE
jgi:transketolase